MGDRHSPETIEREHQDAVESAAWQGVAALERIQELAEHAVGSTWDTDVRAFMVGMLPMVELRETREAAAPELAKAMVGFAVMLADAIEVVRLERLALIEEQMRAGKKGRKRA